MVVVECHDLQAIALADTARPSPVEGTVRGNSVNTVGTRSAHPAHSVGRVSTESNGCSLCSLGEQREHSEQRQVLGRHSSIDIVVVPTEE